ncbi:sugar ABC transporter ATP-binding protein [Fodinisporobacter ferrooxydans]|uniref:Sugar ABC transporter ATP-binding protein n=1 Tax=Fodinisporobacter ferrooxydans TaxID=2901836 RepID=A0ABY4CQJ9_9BACL|nr:sugar ABC transporter ATP-binding protein [Alicyclobacillaceae bacterium MYW30-H2]
MEPLIKMQDIVVQFRGIPILQEARLEIQKGEVHALLGENGAGKSSLMKVLAGLYQKQSGNIEINGREAEFHSPQDAMQQGISMIHQELQLASHLTVAENIFLGRERCTKFGIVKKREMELETTRILCQLAPEIRPNDLVGNLGIAKQQMVAIAKALSTGAQVIIMDEATTALTDNEVTRFFDIVRSLKSQGVAIILITHRLDEVFDLADRATVMRDSRTIETVVIKAVQPSDLIRLMVGRELNEIYPKSPTTRGREGLRVEGLSSKKLLKDIHFTAYRGEVLGIVGLMGSGRTEIMRAIFGVDPIAHVNMFIDGAPVRIKSCRDAIQNRIAYLTEDRKGNGLALNLDVGKNIVMPVLERVSPFGIMQPQQEKQISAKYIRELSIKIKDTAAPIGILSGGNQQKVMLSKWLATDAEIFLLDEPTRGIDVQTKVEVYNLINRLTDAGKTVIMTSSYLPEIMAMSDRFIVLCEGRMTAELTRAEATPENLIYYASLHKDYAV